MYIVHVLYRSLTCQVYRSDISIHCRPTQISQVLVNLIANSRHAIEELPEKWIRISAKTEGKFVEIKVTDSGKGIPEDEVDKVFDAFYTSRGPLEASGLGLSIAKQIVESHNGSIEVVKDSPNTCFLVKLPTEWTS